MICSALAASLDTEYSIGRYNRGERGGGLRLRLNGGWTGPVAGTSPTRAGWEFGHIAEEARPEILGLSALLIAIMNQNSLYSALAVSTIMCNTGSLANEEHRYHVTSSSRKRCEALTGIVTNACGGTPNSPNPTTRQSSLHTATARPDRTCGHSTLPALGPAVLHQSQSHVTGTIAIESTPAERPPQDKEKIAGKQTPQRYYSLPSFSSRILVPGRRAAAAAADACPFSLRVLFTVTN